jgi:hypothetical protein
MPPSTGIARSQRFAYALFEPPAAAPGVLLRRALEERGGNPLVRLAASDYGALFVIFGLPEMREEVMARFPLELEGHLIKLERPEDGCNRFAWRYSSFAHISATGFPLEYWDEGGIRTAFRSIGSVCCIDPLCLDKRDFSAMRLVLKLENASNVPATLLVRDSLGASSAVVDIHLVHTWGCEEDGRAPGCVHFDNHLSAGANQALAGGRRQSRMSDIDDDSIRGISPPPPTQQAPSSAVLNL